MVELVTKRGLNAQLYLYTNEQTNQKRLDLIQECISIDNELGNIIKQCLEIDYSKRINSHYLNLSLKESKISSIDKQQSVTTTTTSTTISTNQ